MKVPQPPTRRGGLEGDRKEENRTEKKSNVLALYNNRAVTILVFYLVFLSLTVMNQSYLESREESQSYILTIRINQLIIMNGP